jgi:DNA topoisomerase-1
MRICKVQISTLAKEDSSSSSANNIPQWFKDMSEEQQKAYLEEHPNSKIAKTVKSSKKTDKPAAKEKKDPYAGVPEKDRLVMIAAKERGHTVPPAWRDVWLNDDPAGDMQVKGKDAKGRTQYLYSINHNTRQAALKFERVKQFTKEYPEMAKKIEKDMETSEEAKVLYLISKTGFRIGDEKDTKAKVKAYGASNLTSEHIKITGETVSFDFIGKEGVHQKHTVEDPKLAKMLKGKKGSLFNTKPAKIHAYLDGISENHYKVKDFRTFVATSTALHAIKTLDPPPPPMDQKAYEKAVNAVAKLVSAKLGNTPKMARDSYIDPTVFKGWQCDIDNASTIKKKETSSSSSEEYKAMVDFIETNHYEMNRKLVEKLKSVRALPKGSEERQTAYKEFQQLAKKLGMLARTKDKQEYIKSVKELESALSVKHVEVSHSVIPDHLLLKLRKCKCKEDLMRLRQDVMDKMRNDYGEPQHILKALRDEIDNLIRSHNFQPSGLHGELNWR